MYTLLKVHQKIRKACLGKNTTIVYRYFYFKSSSINKFLTVGAGVEPASPPRHQLNRLTRLPVSSPHNGAL